MCPKPGQSAIARVTVGTTGKRSSFIGQSEKLDWESGGLELWVHTVRRESDYREMNSSKVKDSKKEKPSYQDSICI